MSHIELKLGNNLYAKISEEDADVMSLGSWTAHGSKSGNYACMRTTIGGMRQRVWLHTLIMEELIGRSLKKDELVDHINQDKLDCRRSNLRMANRTQNNANKGKRKGTSSQYKGVSWSKKHEKWRCYIVIDRKLKHLGLFDDEKEAGLKYNKAAAEVFKEFATLNKIK
jgi:hypothetical protein